MGGLAYSVLVIGLSSWCVGVISGVKALLFLCVSGVKFSRVSLQGVATASVFGLCLVFGVGVLSGDGSGSGLGELGAVLGWVGEWGLDGCDAGLHEAGSGAVYVGLAGVIGG